MSTLVLRRRRDPFPGLDALFRPTVVPVIRSTGFSPATEVSRDGDDAVVRVELPGLDADRDITVEVDRGHLIVRGERRDERSDERDGRMLREVRYGAFRRSFSLPEHVTGDDVTASYDTGVLSVRVSGAYAGITPRRIPVNGAAAVDEATGPAESTGDEQAA
ncbi:MAG TPA: Hsp20/alpha crystallin family protein [Jiangellaceae bacterium]|jgi:HSP20 family protein|nr:Hsp20/alpha crystallin family protein [Jiangellaceae bacterium]